MTGRRVQVAAFVVVVLWTTPAWAIDPVADGLLATQVKIMTAQLFNQLKEIAAVGEVFLVLKEMIQTSNEVAAMARWTKRTVDAIRHYGLDDLKRDALAGLHDAFPELASLENEADLFMSNLDSAREGGDAFFGMRDYRDQQTQDQLTRVAQQGIDATLYAKLFPKAYKKSAALGVTEADKLVLGKFLRTGRLEKWAAMVAAQKALNAQNAKKLAEAADQNRVDLNVQGITAEATARLAEDSAFERAMLEADKAEEEAARRRGEFRTAVGTRGIQEHIEEAMTCVTGCMR